MNGINSLHSLWRIACFLFLALVCCGQVYQASHLHHFHVNDSVEFSVSAHPFASVSAQEKTHHHHEDNPSHEDDREHTFKKNIDWNVHRSKTVAHITFDFEDGPALISDYSLGSVVLDDTYPRVQTLSCQREDYTAYLIIRGPPQLV